MWKLVVCVCALAAALDFGIAVGREWSDSTGNFKLEAEFLNLEGSQVVLRKPDGKTIRMSIAKLCRADRDEVRRLAAIKPSSNSSAASKADDRSDSNPDQRGKPATPDADKPATDKQAEKQQGASAEDRPDAASTTAVVFRRLPLESTPACMAVTENGEQLLVAHADANRISVWDMRTGQPVKQIKCSAPGFIICRGDRAYVANQQKGTISIVSQKDWSLVDEVQSGHTNLVYLSAPQGKFFKGNLLAVAMDSDKTSARAAHVFFVDTKSDHHREIFEERAMSVATVDYAGKAILCQGPISWSPSATIENIYDYARTAVLKAPEAPIATGPNRFNRPLNRPNGPEPLPFQRQHQDTDILAQPIPGPWWIGVRQVWHGMPPAPKAELGGDFVIADSQRAQVYVFNSQVVRCLSLAAELAELGTQAVRYPAVSSDDNSPSDTSKPSQTKSTTTRRKTTLPRSRNGKAAELFHDVAATLGDRVSFVHFDSESQSLLFASTKSFGGGSALTKVDVGSGQESAAWPARVAVSHRIVFKLFDDKAKREFTLLDGPKGLQVSDAGEVSWTPSKGDLGEQHVKIRVTTDGDASFVRLTTQVVESAKEVSDGSSALASGGQHQLNDPNFKLQYTYDGKGMLLLDGDTVSLLDKTGATVVDSHQFDRRYMQFLERAEYYVALAPKSITLIEKKTWKEIKEIQLDYPQLQDLALSPAEKYSYVTLRDKSGLGIDETTGKVDEYRQLLGYQIAADPQGHFLFGMIKQTYQRGITIDAYTGMLRNAYGSADVLFAYDIRGHVPRPNSLNIHPGQNGSHMVLAPDGKNVGYVSGGGAVGAMYALQSFHADDVDKESARYQISAYPTDMAFHPSIDMAVCANGSRLWFFRRSTGEELDKVLDPSYTQRGTTRVFFAPDGTHLMIGSDPTAQLGPLARPRILESVKLTIKPKDAAAAEAGYIRPALVPRIKDPGPGMMQQSRTSDGQTVEMAPSKIPPADIEALKPSFDKSLSAKEVVRKYGRSVVLIRTEIGTGTGFVIGSKGYILSCAHVVAGAKELHVQYNSMAGGSEQSIEVTGTLKGFDSRNDLALLKIETNSPLTPVHFAAAAVESGEDVTVIGNPGMGDKILSKTVTTGVVSSPQRLLDGIPYIQLSAAVNPGNSGGPMFNSRGEVIGVVTAKARIENTGFATPIPSVLTFLGLSGHVSSAKQGGTVVAANSANEGGAKNTAAADAPRLWHSTNGKTLEAVLVRVEDGLVYLKKNDGSVIPVPIEKLAESDVNYLKTGSK